MLVGSNHCGPVVRAVRPNAPGTSDGFLRWNASRLSLFQSAQKLIFCAGNRVPLVTFLVRCSDSRRGRAKMPQIRGLAHLDLNDTGLFKQFGPFRKRGWEGSQPQKI
jgi:hypothetical protein